MPPTTEKIPFQAETKELLQLVVHSLYTRPEIFLRELISNASDALDKLRVEALTDASLLAEGEEPSIRLAVDSEARVLCVIDDGIGMSREEVTENLGTIARSGTKRFLEALRSAGKEAGAPELIGQFGVGFYSSFMVAGEVVVETRRAGEEGGTRWTSDGEGDFTVEDCDKPGRGTTIMLHLREREEQDETPDFADPAVLRALVKRYSDFVEYPIRMQAGEGDEAQDEVLNSRRPLWTRPRHEVKEGEYAEFYKHLTHDWNEPLETVHFKAEGSIEYTALLFVPRRRPMDLFDPEHARSRVQLYVRRVFVMADCEEALPPWLRFVRGVVDAADLPLNVSRETLQRDRDMSRIRKRLTRKVLDALAAMLKERRDDYREFWSAFGAVLKEGLYHDEEEREKLAELCLFASSAGPEPTTLAEYVERMPVKQQEIHVLVAADLAAAERSPHREALAARGYEVLYLTDSVDEFVLQRLTEFQGRKLRRIDRGELPEEEGEERGEREAAEKELSDLPEAVRKELAEAVESVRFSSRLTDSPACLVGGEHDLPAQLERFLRETGQEVPARKRVLELNAAHPLVQRLGELSNGGEGLERFGELCELVHGQALLAEGSALPDPARFTKLLTDRLLAVEGTQRSE